MAEKPRGLKLSKEHRLWLDNAVNDLANDEITEVTAFEKDFHWAACGHEAVAKFQAILAFRLKLGYQSIPKNKKLNWITPEGLLLELMRSRRAAGRYFGEEEQLLVYMMKVCDPQREFPAWPANLSFDYAIYKIADPPLEDSLRPGPLLNCVRVDGARVLCIDGGGTRGFVPLEILEQIENCLPQGNRKITECFDWIVGTSTGGLIALYLSLGYSTADCRKMYVKFKDSIFAGSRPPYSASNLELKLKEAVGEGRRMWDIPVDRIRCVITSTIGSEKNLTPVLFTNYDPDTMDKYIWEVARCTSAAPYFFNPYKDPLTGAFYYDGGLTANNPTLLALNEITRVSRTTGQKGIENGLVLSLGTGMTSPDPGGPGSLDLTVSRSWPALLSMAKTLFAVLLNQVTKSDGEVVTTAATTCLHANCYYLRLNPTLPEPVELDETDNQKLANMIYHAKAYANSYRGRIKDICRNLAPGGRAAKKPREAGVVWFTKRR